MITHAMYAAGHPPLPSFEAATFCNLEPRHWQNVNEKSPERVSLMKPAPDRRGCEQTQLVLVGELVALRESLKLLAPDTAATRPATSGAAWPDFARFDCYACHHELRAGDAAPGRQLRQSGSFGRPMPPEWPLVLVPLGIGAAGGQTAPVEEEQFRKHVAAMSEGVRMRPFGDPDATAKATGDFVTWIDSLLKRLDHAVIDHRQARELLERLGEIAGEPIPDYNSARQIAWAFRVIYRESTPKDKRDPKIEAEMAGLASDLALDLPPARTQILIEASIPARLRFAAEFDPASFQARFQRIKAQLTRR